MVGPRIEALLDEWRPWLVGKHRLTSPRVHRELIEEGYSVGERTVRQFLAEKRRQAAEVYIPPVHRPGDEAQVDFFEVTVDEKGRRRKAWKFLMRLIYSGRDFIHLYDRCDRPCFLDGHVRAFTFLGGVTRRLVYDNLAAAVKRILGLKDRELTDRFKALSSHYLFVYPPDYSYARLQALVSKSGKSYWDVMEALDRRAAAQQVSALLG